MSLWVFWVLYFRVVAVNGHFLLELTDLEISFCNVYGACVGWFCTGVVLFGLF